MSVNLALDATRRLEGEEEYEVVLGIDDALQMT